MGFTERLRRQYPGGRPGEQARRANHRMARLASTGLLGWWLIRLDTVNPLSGTALSVPLITAKVGGRHYLVSMLGQGSRWVRNVRAAHGRVSIRASGKQHDVVLKEIESDLRATILKSYLGRAPGGRPHIPISRKAPLSEFAAIAGDFPVFEISIPRPAPGPRSFR